MSYSVLRFALPALTIALTLVPSAGGGDSVLGKKRIEWLKDFYTGKELKSRRAGLIAIEIMGPKQEGILPALMQRLGDEPDEGLRTEIAQTLGRMGEEARDAVPSLSTTLRKDKSPRVREAAARALGGSMVPHSKKAVKELAAALRDEDSATRTAVAETLKDLGLDGIQALPDLLETAKLPKLEEATKIYVVHALVRFGNGVARETAPVFDELLIATENPLGVRVAAAEALGRLGKDGSRSIPALRKAMAHGGKDIELRKAAILAFGKVGGPSKETWVDLQDLFTDYDSFMRLQTVRLSGPLGVEIPDVILELEAAALSDQYIEVRVAAVQELGALGSAASSAAPTLQSISVNGRSAALRDAAKTALKKVKG